MKRFGKHWAHPEVLEPCETPVGTMCFHCPEAILEDSEGVVMPYVKADGEVVEVAVHRDCLLRACGIDPTPAVKA